MSSSVMSRDFDGILLDNEGTLIDATEATRRCWGAFAAWYDLPPQELLALVPGRPAREVIGQLSARLPVPADDALHRYLAYAAECETGIRPVPGAARLLADVPAGRWVVVTSGTRDFALKRIAAAGLPEPAHVVAAEDVTRGKPDPEPYLAAARRLGADPGECLAVDDSPAGIESASRAGCTTLALLTTHDSRDLPRAGACAGDLSQLQVSGNGGKLHAEILPRNQLAMTAHQRRIGQ